MARRVSAAGSYQFATSSISHKDYPWAASFVYWIGADGRGSYSLTQIHGHTSDPYDLSSFVVTSGKSLFWSHGIQHGDVIHPNTFSSNSTATTPALSWGRIASFMSVSAGGMFFNGSQLTVSQIGYPGAAITSNMEAPATQFGLSNVEYRFAEAAVYATTFTVDQGVAITNLFCPLLVCPLSIKGYWPLGGPYGLHDRDLVGTNHMVPPAVAAWADHPKTIYPCECLCC